MERFRPGDLFACFDRSLIGKVISWRTASLLRLTRGASHVAIASAMESDGPLRWVESTSLCQRPCLFHGDRVSGCQVHEITDRINDYTTRGGTVELYRLNRWSRLNSDHRKRLMQLLLDFVARGVGYDTLGAWASVHTWARYQDADLDHVFCSELLAIVLMEMGRLPRGNPARYHPGKLIRHLKICGVYRHVETYFSVLERESCSAA